RPIRYSEVCHRTPVPRRSGRTTTCRRRPKRAPKTIGFDSTNFLLAIMSIYFHAGRTLEHITLPGPKEGPGKVMFVIILDVSLAAILTVRARGITLIDTRSRTGQLIDARSRVL